MEFGVLGSLQMGTAEERAVRGPLQRRVLAVLLCRRNQPVSVDWLAEMLWPALTETAARRLHLTVHRLRTSLGDPDRLVSVRGGYLLRVYPDELDAERFESLRAVGLQAVAAGNADLAAASLRRASALWRGDAYAELDDVPVLAEEAERLSELRLSALEQLYAAEVERGVGSEVTAELIDVVGRYPLRERFSALLMMALAQTGRRADALEVYCTARLRLVDELGMEPGRELRRVHASILATEEPSLLSARGVAPHQLPPGIRGFVGREADLARLDSLLRSAALSPALPAIVAITGTAGIGKTALALRWAQQVQGSYPGGQLFADLRGYSPDKPVDAETVVDGFLRALGVPGAQIPADADQRQSLLRTVLAERRTLLLLDNARNSAQVRPLVAGPSSLVIITSRDQLRGLAAREGAMRLELKQLEASSAVAILDRGVPACQRAERHADLLDVADLCGRMPLALAIAAERIARQPEALTTVRDDLRDERQRLDVLVDPNDADTDIRIVLSWSYRALEVESARIFRLLATIPAGDFGVPAAAATAGTSEIRMRRELDRLLAANLIQDARPGRYQYHDLVRLLAQDLLESSDPPDERAAALQRLVSWYGHSAENARRLIQRFAPLMVGDEPCAGVRPLDFTAASDALSWFDTERSIIAALLARSGTDDLHRDMFRLASATSVHLGLRSSPREALSVQQIALAAARRSGDRVAEAIAANQLGTSNSRLGNYDLAVTSLRDAVRIFRDQNHLPGVAAAEGNLGLVLSLSGKPEEALPHQQRSLRISRDAGHTNEVGRTLNNIAMIYLELGRPDDAIDAASQALEIHRDIGDPVFESFVADTLGVAHSTKKEYAEAVHWFEHTLELSRTVGNQWNEADTLHSLGLALRAMGRSDAAHAAWARCLWILEEIDAPDSAKLSRTGLADLLTSVSPDASAGC